MGGSIGKDDTSTTLVTERKRVSVRAMLHGWKKNWEGGDKRIGEGKG